LWREKNAKVRGREALKATMSHGKALNTDITARNSCKCKGSYRTVHRNLFTCLNFFPSCNLQLPRFRNLLQTCNFFCWYNSCCSWISLLQSFPTTFYLICIEFSCNFLCSSCRVILQVKISLPCSSL
jgi:hypothetical protein